MTIDTLIRGGTVIDGTGGPAYAADVAIAGGRIVAIGALPAEAERTIDAAGLVVAPGFIDCHTHDDGVLITSPAMEPKISQGVTSVVTGNCGISLAPLAGGPVVPPLNLLGADALFRFRTFAAFLDELDANPAAVNVIPLVGHTTLRAATMARLDRGATPDEVAAMAALTAEALDAGAVGFSTGVYYPNAMAATGKEVVEVGAALKGRNRVYCAHIRNEGDWIVPALEEAFEIGRQLEARTVISHHKLVGVRNHGRSAETLPLIQGRRARQEIGLDVYPYPAGSSVLSGHALSGDPGERVMIAWSTPHPEFSGRMIDEAMAELGLDLAATIAELSPAGAIYFQMHEDDMRAIMAYGATMIGSDGLPNDAHPHPRLWGTFPRVIGHYARDLGLFSTETAVHKMTGMTAAMFGISDRGTVRVGAKADVTLFDPAAIRDTATWDNPTARAEGIVGVLVNGTEVWRDGRHTNATPGEVVRATA